MTGLYFWKVSHSCVRNHKQHLNSWISITKTVKSKSVRGWGCTKRIENVENVHVSLKCIWFFSSFLFLRVLYDDIFIIFNITFLHTLLKGFFMQIADWIICVYNKRDISSIENIICKRKHQESTIMIFVFLFLTSATLCSGKHFHWALAADTIFSN